MAREQKIQLLQDIKQGEKTIHDIPQEQEWDFTKWTAFELELSIAILKKYTTEENKNDEYLDFDLLTTKEVEFFQTLWDACKERPAKWGDEKNSSEWVNGSRMDNWERQNELRDMSLAQRLFIYSKVGNAACDKNTPLPIFPSQVEGEKS
jgi:hypothetical protein